jgi:hypothetical protein
MLQGLLIIAVALFPCPTDMPQHFSLTLQWIDGNVMLVLTYERQCMKGYWTKRRWQLPAHSFYEIYTESVPLLFSRILYFLSLAGGDGAFQDYNSAQEVLDEADRCKSSLQNGHI